MTEVVWEGQEEEGKVGTPGFWAARNVENKLSQGRGKARPGHKTPFSKQNSAMLQNS